MLHWVFIAPGQAFSSCVSRSDSRAGACRLPIVVASLVAACRIFQDRGSIHTRRWIFSHWTTRKVLNIWI